MHILFPLLPVGGGVEHPEARSDGVRRPLCRDVQRRQQAQTLHSYRNDWLPGAGAAGELANDEALIGPIVWVFGFYAGIYQ